MAGSVNSLGLGSSGVLSYDVIDKLRNRDDSVLVKPIDNKILKLGEKKESLLALKALTTAVKANVSGLSDDTLFLDREVSVSNEDIAQVTVENGVREQKLDLEILQVAKENIIQSKSFKSSEDIVSKSDGVLKIRSSLKEEDIEIKAGTSLEELAQKINEEFQEEITASIINSSLGDYRLVLRNKKTGLENELEVSGKLNNILRLGSELDENIVQEAADAIFKYNGMNVQRDSNKIEDLVVGLKINIKEPGALSLSIDMNKGAIIEQVNSFVESYNKFNMDFTELTKFDLDSKVAGPLQGESTILRMKSDIMNILTSSNSKGVSLSSFGISLNKNSFLDFDSAKFSKALSDNPKLVNEFFVGKDISIAGTPSKEQGVFKKLNDVLEQYINPSRGSLEYLSQNYERQTKNLNKEKISTKDRLDTKYNMMANKFASYDDMIGKMNSSFGVLKSQIDAQSKGN